MLRSLRVRLLLTLMSVVLIAVGTVAIFISVTTTTAFQRYLENDTLRNQRIFGTLQTFLGQHEAERDYGALAQRMKQVLGERFILTDASGTVLADSSATLVGQRLDTQTTGSAAIFSIGVPPPELGPVAAEYMPGMVAAPDDQLYYSFSMPATATRAADGAAAPAKAGQPVFAQRTHGRMADPISAAFIDTVNRSLLLAAAAAGIAALGLAIALGQGILKPIATLTEAARKLERGELNERVPVRSRDELGVLGNAFNAMADGLQRQEALRRNLVGDVAHELRTPLTNIRGYLEAVRDGVAEPDAQLIDSLHEEAILLNRLVDDLQELALAEAGQLRLDRQPVVLGEVVQGAVRAMLPGSTAKRVHISTDIPPNLPAISADAERIGQILRNLLANAITHTPRGGSIGVALRAEGEHVVLRVRDTGSGIAPEHLPYI